MTPQEQAGMLQTLSTYLQENKNIVQIGDNDVTVLDAAVAVINEATGAVVEGSLLCGSIYIITVLSHSKMHCLRIFFIISLLFIFPS